MIAHVLPFNAVWHKSLATGHTCGKYLADFANVPEWIAEWRLEIDQARLLMLRATWRLDQHEGLPGRARAKL